MKEKKVSYAKWGYIFALPFCITYLVCMIYPVIYTLVIGFTDMEGVSHKKIGLPTKTVEIEANKEIVEHFTGVRDVLNDRKLEASEKNKKVAEMFLDSGKVLVDLSFLETVENDSFVEQFTRLKDSLNDPSFEGQVVEHFLNFRSVADEQDFIKNLDDQNLTKQYSNLKGFIDNSLYREETLQLFFDFINVVQSPDSTEKIAACENAEQYLAFVGAVKNPAKAKEAVVSYLNFEDAVKNQTFIKNIQFKEVTELFGNFKAVLKDPLFRQSMKNTLIIWIVNFIPQIVLAFILAAWFTNARMKLRGKGFFKVVFYMPNIITAATIAMLFTSLFAYPTGAVNDLLVRLEILEKPWEFPMSDLASKLVVAFIQFWMWYGYTMIVLISGILGISPELFEAADIDGANGVQKFFRITLPNLKQIVLFTLVTSMIGGLQMFDIPNMYNAATGNRRAIRTVAVLIQEKSFGNAYLYNQGAAISMVMFVIVAILAGIIFFVMRDKDEIKQHKIEKAQIKAFKKQMREEKMKEASN